MPAPHIARPATLTPFLIENERGDLPSSRPTLLACPCYSHVIPLFEGR